jgi:Domain of unknown function (DUF4402)
MFPRMKTTFFTMMMTGMLALPAVAVDLDTNALLDIVEGITVVQTTALNFGDVAMNDGTITVSTVGTLTDPNFISYDGTNISQGVFDVTAIAGATYNIDLVETVPAVGLLLENFRLNIDGAPDEVGVDSFIGVTLPNQNTTMNVGADLTVDSATATLGDNQTIGYRIAVNFN